MYQVLRTEIVTQLCFHVETDLRLHVHSKHLRHMDEASAVKDHSSMRPIAHWLRAGENLEILGRVFSISTEVTHYLNCNFYNLTTVALHDWRTYSEMRALAREKYGLELLNNFLPMGSLDQGLDVLQIMRNIHIFVARFAYNLNSQEFVEYKPDQTKHINTIKTVNIAASIRQHGLGVLNTTVNFTYQYLVRKFEIFSKFLNDKYIIAHVSKVIAAAPHTSTALL
jgi:WASH complex subunit 7